MNERRIGAYGGTFDPVHNGHVEIARAVACNFKLDELLIIPAHRPPHKTEHVISDAYHRYAMAVLATIDEPRIRVSTIELDAPDKPYSFQTVERLREIYGARARLYFVMGADSFEEISTWREPQRLIASANIVVVTRPGSEIKTSHVPVQFRSSISDLRGQAKSERMPSDEEDAGAYKIYLTDYVNLDVSSTEIRRMARDGENIRGLVPPRVADYVEKYELYRR
ncbi:MAG TPA: nicotinate-nucleotide adenylyltransferase [Blastocatellia bacterium]|nr:nicotinate-nucleotide adenylyltransferase [Blastocatellia bacterium]